jgi:hypothetical protein
LHKALLCFVASFILGGILESGERSSKSLTVLQHNHMGAYRLTGKSSRLAPVTVLFLLAAAFATAQEQAPAASDASSAEQQEQQPQVNQTLAYVNATIPSFYAIRSCLPFTVLVRPESYTGPPGTDARDARIEILADYYVVNATQASVSNGILALSLLHGFETNWPVQITVYTSPSRQLRYAANFASGTLVIGPGLNVSSFEVGNTGVGRVLAYDLTAEALRINSTG